MSEHHHDHDHDSHDVALLDPADCQHFMESAHMHEHMHEHGHDHGHHHHDHDHSHVTKVTWRLITMIILTGIMFLAELITGFVTKSLSLQSDAFHMLSDEASLIIGLVAHRISKKPPTNSMTFGYARAEVLGGLVNSTFLLGICLTLLFEAIERLVETEPIEEPTAFLIVGAIVGEEGRAGQYEYAEIWTKWSWSQLFGFMMNLVATVINNRFVELPFFSYPEVESEEKLDDSQASKEEEDNVENEKIENDNAEQAIAA